MKRNIHITWNVIKICWHANGVYVLILFFTDAYTSTLFPLIQFLLLAKVIDLLTHALQTHLQITDFVWIGLAYAFASALNYYLASYQGLKEAYFQGKLETYLHSRVIKKLTELDPATFEKAKFQSLLSQVTGTFGVMVVLLSRVSMLINAAVKVVVATIVIVPLFPIIVPVVIVSTIPLYLISDKFRVKLWPFFSDKRTHVIRLINYIETLLSADSTSKEAAIFKVGNVMSNKANSTSTGYIQAFNKTSESGIHQQFGANLLQIAAFVYALYLLINSVLKNMLSIGQFTVYFQQIMSLSTGVENLLSGYSSISMRTENIDLFFQFLNTKKVITSPESPKPLTSNPTPPEIVFKDVSFAYPKTDRNILQNFNLTIKPGEKIALVGENGAGKTTLIKLLLRFYDVIAGEILINGVNIKDLNLDEWHTYIGALFQDFIKYQFTFKENVYLGNITEKDNEKLLRVAISKSGADKYLDNLPKGIEQTVGKMFEGGIDLSGGQWQKLALARAFFRDAPILILDEPTAAIDAKAEYEIFQNVQKLQTDKTVIIISHRFSTVRNADRILVLDEGKIVEEGNHEQLMKKKGLYAELFEIQARGYK